MSRKTRTMLLASCVVGLAGASYAVSIDGNAGTRGYKFLQVPTDPASAARAGASVAIGGSVTELGENPAAIADIARVQATVSHVEWLSAVRHEHLAVALPGFGGALAFGLTTQSSGDIPLRSIDAGGTLTGVPSETPFGVYGVYDAAVKAAYARRAGSFAWGVSASYIHEKIYLSSASAVAFDVGGQWSHGPWSAGAAVRNFGFSGRMTSERIPMPWDARAGAAWEAPVLGMPTRVAADVRYAPDWFTTAHIGADVRVAGPLTIRFGYQTGGLHNPGDTGITAGLGVTLGALSLDYAYLPSRDGLGTAQLLSATLHP